MRGVLWLLFSFVSLLCIGCDSRNAADYHNPLTDWLKKNDKVKVLSTTCMIGDVVQRIGGEHVDNLTLIGSELDPHSYQLVKGDTEKLQFADLIFFNGLGLEHSPSLHQQLTNNNRAVGLGDAVAAAMPEKILTYNGQTDPHIWMDISIWSQIIPYITQALSEEDPEHANDYRKQAESLMREMVTTHEAVKDQLQSVPEHKRFLVTSHDAFNYFARAYLATDDEAIGEDWAKRFQAPEGLAPESQLSSSDIQFILDHLTTYQIHIIFPESNVSRDSIHKIVDAARGSGLHVTISDVALYGDAMGKPGSGANSYLDMVRYNARVLKEHLNGQSDQ